jgi:hypothetical protein
MMIAMTGGAIPSQHFSAKPRACAPSDEHRHLRHRAMIWHILCHIIERKENCAAIAG